MTEQQLTILRKYFPAPAVQAVADWIPRHGVFLSVTRRRTTKHGDFTLSPIRGMNRITVNGSLNPYAFLLTFVHELAHLVVLKKHGAHVQPHGKQWKDEFRSLMLMLDLRTIYPHDILVPMADYLKDPKASSDRHTALALALKRYDAPGEGDGESADDPMICELAPGVRFLFREKREFVLGEKRRRLYLCTDVSSGRQYLFQPHIRVKIKDDDE